MSSTIYHPVRTPPPALGNSTAPAARVAKVLSGAGGASQSGIWVAIFAITMSFAAFTSALFVRQGSAADWTHIALPPILYGNTLALLLSSATLHMARRKLAAQGLYLATNPNSSFYYVLTAMHGLHVLAGIVALALVMGRIVASRAAFRKSTFEATATYWHFMGVLWLYLLLVLRTKL